MGMFQRLFDFYINASIHVAFGVFALTYVTIKTFGLKGDDHLAWFLFFGTIVCYNFIKYGVEAKKYIIVANPYQKNIQLVSFLAALIGSYHAYFLQRDIWLGILVLVLLTGLYAIPVLPNARNLRNLGGLKIFLVALVWAGATVVLPTLGSSHPVTWDVWVETAQRFFFVLALLIPFEIRDLKYDDPELRTLPQRFGVWWTKMIGVLFVLLFYVLTFFKDDVLEVEIIVKTLLFFGLIVLMFSFGKKQSRYFASFWVEAIPIAWYFLWVLCLGFC